MLNFDELFGDGLRVRVRTGRKVDDKHVTEAIAVNPAAWPKEFVALVFEAGARAVVAEKLNTIATEGGKKLEAARALFGEADRGEMPKDCVRVRGAGGGASDPVLVEAIKLARVDLMTFAKVKNMVEAAKDARIGKFFTVSANGSVSDNVQAFEAFIAKNDPTKDYTGRAKAIVSARVAGAADDIELEL